MTHPLIDQYHFTRREWLRGLAGLSEQDGAHHFGPMNCISWIVAHLAWHEQRYWLEFAQGETLFPNLNVTYAYGAPMSTPSLQASLDIWHAVSQAANPYLNSLTTDALQGDLLRDGKSVGQSVGSALLRVNYHYWFHIGEIQAIRQMLGHADLPEYVGDIETEAAYRPE